MTRNPWAASHRDLDRQLAGAEQARDRAQDRAAWLAKELADALDVLTDVQFCDANAARLPVPLRARIARILRDNQHTEGV